MMWLLIPDNEAVLFNWPYSVVFHEAACLVAGACSVCVLVTFTSAKKTSKCDYVSSDDHVLQSGNYVPVLMPVGNVQTSL